MAGGYAGVEDVEVDFGPIPADQVERVTALLERAEAQLRAVVTDLDARVADRRTERTLVVQVLSEMVAGVLRNPAGYRSSTTSRTEGPYSASTSGTFAGDTATGRLELTRRHRRLLGVPAGARSISLSSPAADPGVAHPFIPPTSLAYEGRGYVWPDPVTGLPTP